MSATRPRIVFLTYHGTGHFNISLGIAKILREKYDVVFAGVQFFQKYVEDKGFPYYPLTSVPFGLGLEEWMNTVRKKKPLYFHTLKDRWQDDLYHLRTKELKQLLVDLDPYLILLDAQQSTDFIVLYPLVKERSVRLAVLHAMFPTALSKGIPPINSLVLPGDEHAVKQSHQKVKWEKLKKYWLQKLKFFGLGDPSIIRRRVRRNNIPRQYLSDQFPAFNYTITGVHELILIHRRFDFPEVKVAPRQFYLGSLIDFHRQDSTDPAYLSLRDTILETASEKKLSLIYCSFGTLPQQNQPLVVAFLQKLIDATRDQRCLLVIAQKLEPGVLSGPHVYVFSHLPQLDILSHADLLITHGGLNSVKEAIALNVPMLVYPFESKVDHHGNSSRVVYHGLGLRGDAATETIEGIREKVYELLTNPIYKDNIRKLNEVRDSNAEEILALVSTIPLLD